MLFLFSKWHLREKAKVLSMTSKALLPFSTSLFPDFFSCCPASFTPLAPCWCPHCSLQVPFHSCHGAFSGMLFPRYLPTQSLTSFKSFLKFLLLSKAFHSHSMYNFTSELHISFPYFIFLSLYGMVCLLNLFIVYLSH